MPNYAICRALLCQSLEDIIAAYQAADVALDGRLNVLESGGGGGGGAGSGVYDAVDYGLVGNGVADDCVAIQAAINAASGAGGGIVHLPAKQIALSSAVITLPSNVGIRGAGAGRTVLLQKFWPNSSASFSTQASQTIQATGTLGTSLSCSAVAPAATTITGISSTSGLSVGQYLLLASRDIYWSGFATRYRGELVRVKTVDSGTAITVHGVVRDNYATAPVTVTPLGMVENVSVEDLTIKNTEPATTHATGMLGFLRCRNVRVNNVEIIGSDYAGVRLTNVFDGNVTNCSMYDGPSSPGTDQFGYGVLLECAAEDIVIDSCRFVRGRHAVTTGGLSGTLGGSPRNVVVSNNIARDYLDTAFDTHQTGGEVLFVGNTVIGCMSAAFTSRSTACRFVGNLISYCRTGIIVYGESGGVGHGTQVIDNTIRHIWGDTGIRINDPDRVVLSGNTISGIADAGIYIVDNATRLHIVNNVIENTGLDNGSAKAGILFASGCVGTGHRIEANTFYNGSAVTGEAFSGAGNMDYPIKNLAAGVTGSYWMNNTSVGSITGFVQDAGSGNTSLNNVQDGAGGDGSIAGEISLADYGTTSAAGTALNAAIAALPSTGGVIRVPSGSWTIDTPVLFSKSNVTIEGVGNGAQFLFNGTSVATAFANADTTNRTVHLRNFSISQTSAGNAGVAIEFSHITRGVIDNVYIGGSSGSTNAPVGGILLTQGGANGTYYNSIQHCRVQAGGASSYCIEISDVANSNTVHDVRLLGSTTATGIRVGAHAVTLSRVDVETNLAFGIDVQAGGNDCTIVSPYLEGNDVNLRLAAGVEAATVIGGVIIDADTNNIVDNGALGLSIVNTRINLPGSGSYDPLTYRTNNAGLASRRWLDPALGGVGSTSSAFGNVVGSAGVWSQVAIDIPETVYTDAMAYTVGATSNGNVQAALYGPAAADDSGASLALAASSASTAQAAANTTQALAWSTPALLRPGRYYLGVMADGTTATYLGFGTVTDATGRSGYFANSGGFGAGPNATSAAGWVANGNARPMLRLRCAVAPTL